MLCGNRPEEKYGYGRSREETEQRSGLTVNSDYPEKSQGLGHETHETTQIKPTSVISEHQVKITLRGVSINQKAS